MFTHFWGFPYGWDTSWATLSSGLKGMVIGFGCAVLDITLFLAFFISFFSYFWNPIIKTIGKRYFERFSHHEVYEISLSDVYIELLINGFTPITWLLKTVWIKPLEFLRTKIETQINKETASERRKRLEAKLTSAIEKGNEATSR